MIAANAAATNDVITIPAGTYTFTRGASDDTASGGDLDVAANGTLAVTGAGARVTTINANQLDRVFDVQPTASLTMSAVTITNGSQTADVGGGIRVRGSNQSPAASLSLTGVSVVGSQAKQGGGIGLTGNATLSLLTSTVSNDFATQNGGGIYGDSGTTLSLNNSTVSTNHQTSAGVSFGGGGISTANSLQLVFSTIASNAAAGAGGGVQFAGGSATADSSIVSGNTAASPSQANCDTAFTSSGYDLELGGTCGFTQSTDVNGDPALGPLADNKGPTNTQFPAFTSKALNVGDPSCPSSDQRGTTRPQLSGCDIGAVEAEPANLSISMTDSPDPIQVNDTLSYTIVVTNVGTTDAYGVVVRDQLPSSVRPSTSTASQGTCSNTQLEICRIGRIPAGSRETITLRVQTLQAGTVSDTAFAIPTNVDPSPAGNTVTRNTSVTLRSGPCANLQTGTSGPDVLNGTSLGDVLRGLAGNDRLSGFAGSDCLDGGDGDDTLKGGSANDTLGGGAGNDVLKGGSGRDKINGGRGNDTVSARDGERDTIDCGRGAHDKATVDAQDRVKNCETVNRPG